MFRRSLLGGWILALSLMAFTVHAQPTITNVNVGTAFRYQGAIRGVFPSSVSPSGPQSGTLQFRFGLWNDPANTNSDARIAPDRLITLNVSNGFFSTMLDFGDVFRGQRVFLEVSVYAPSNTLPASSNWITIGPRSEIGAVPYALWALQGGSEVLKTDGGYTYGWCRQCNNDNFVGSDSYYSIPGGFLYADTSPLSTNMANFEARFRPKIIEEVRILIGHRSFNIATAPPDYITVTLEIWRFTNSVISSSGSYEVQSLKPEFLRTISNPTNLLLSSVPVGEWIPLTLTNSVSPCRLNPNERLRLVCRGDSSGPNSGYMFLTAEAVVRDAR